MPASSLVHYPRRLPALVALCLLIGFIAPAAATGSPEATPVPADYSHVFGVGHNSGRSLTANRQALLAGADIVEIDVRSLRGVLISSHFPVITVGSLAVFLGPTVEAVWTASTGADAIFLDLKETSERFAQLVIAFLNQHAGERTVIIASPDPVTLDRLAGVAGDILLLHSIHDRTILASLLANQNRCPRIDGVTIRHQLLDAAAIDRLHAAGLLVFAWTVNDLARADELVQFGVDGIITDNLQLLELLGGSRSGERALPTRDTPETPTPACELTGSGH